MQKGDLFSLTALSFKHVVLEAATHRALGNQPLGVLNHPAPQKMGMQTQQHLALGIKSTATSCWSVADQIKQVERLTYVLRLNSYSKVLSIKV